MGNGVVFEAPSSPDFLQQQSFHLLKSDVALVALSFCLATQYQPSSLFWIIFLNADRLMDTQTSSGLPRFQVLCLNGVP